MLLFMLSLGGIPPTAGFMGKFWLFGAAIESGYVWLAVIGVLNSAISLYYYIRIVVFMWIKEENRPAGFRSRRARRGSLWRLRWRGRSCSGSIPAALRVREASAAARRLGRR